MDKKINAKKHFGQNFLQDKNLINKIIASFSPQNKDLILEIGPGMGAITDPLLAKIDLLNLVEIDRDLAKQSKDKYKDKINLYNTDILSFSLQQIIDDATKLGSRSNDPDASSSSLSHSDNLEKSIRIIGNLPYNISTPILFHLFEQIDIIQDMLFMLQLEVVDRMIAQPGSKDYGRLSVMTQFYCSADKLFKIPPTAFIPQPKVESAIVRLVPRPKDFAAKLLDRKVFEDVVRASFNKRRKTITNSLKEFISSSGILEINLDPKARAENLSIEEYIKISNFVTENHLQN